MEAVRTFISTIAEHSEAQLPAWLAAAMTQLVFDFSTGDRGSGAGGWGKELIWKVNLGDEPGMLREVGRVEKVEDGRAVVSINPSERLDIDEIMKIHGELNSASSPAVVIARCAAIVRICARVLALKHGTPNEAPMLKDAIVGCTSLANKLRELAGGEADLTAIHVNAPSPVEESPRPRRKMNLSPEERQRRADRMRQVMKKRQDAEGRNPSTDWDFPAGGDGDDLAEGVGSAAGGAVGSVV